MPSCRRRWRGPAISAGRRWCRATDPTGASFPAHAGRTASSPSRSRLASSAPTAVWAKSPRDGPAAGRPSTAARATRNAPSRPGTSRAWFRVPTAPRRSWSRRRRARPGWSCAASSAREPSRRKRSVRDALERFLIELEAQRRASPHTVAAYRRDIIRVLDLAAAPSSPGVAPGAGRTTAARARPVPASAWTRELLERALRDLYRTHHAPASAARALAAWRSFSRYCLRRGITTTDPARSLPFPRLARRLPRTLPRLDLARALDGLGGAAAARRRDRALG